MSSHTKRKRADGALVGPNGFRIRLMDDNEPESEEDDDEDEPKKKAVTALDPLDDQVVDPWIDELFETVITVQSLKPIIMEYYTTWPMQHRVALTAFKRGDNLFITGGQGVGKTFLTEFLIRHCHPDQTAVTASTAVAATLLGEQANTFNSWTGIGLGVDPAIRDQANKIAKKIEKDPSKLERWQTTRRLFVDEGSMIPDENLDLAADVSRFVLESETAFRGIQVVVIGDLLQLSPIKGGLIVNAKAWKELNFTCVQLDHVYRQNKEGVLARILNVMRFGVCSEEHERMIQATARNKFNLPDGIIPTRIVSKVKEAETINATEMMKLPGASTWYKAIESARSTAADFLTCGLLPVLELKVGAQVIHIQNDKHRSGLINGSQGVVIGFDTTRLFSGSPCPIVRFTNKTVCTVRPYSFQRRRNTYLVVTRDQIPLIPSWALTVHKRQGSTVEYAIVDLGSAFTHAQCYVALSRTSALDRMQVTNFNRRKVTAHPDALAWYAVTFSPVIPKRFSTRGQPVPLDMNARKYAITGSSVGLLLDGRVFEAVCAIFQIMREPETPEMAAGHREEERTAATYLQLREKCEPNGAGIVQTYGTSTRDPDRPFFVGTPDRLGRPGEGLECKYVAGSKNLFPVSIHFPSCKGMNQCKCDPPSHHIDQLFFVAMVCRFTRYDLAKRSAIDCQYMKVDTTPLRWQKENLPKLYEACRLLLFWHWADVCTPDTLRPIRDLFAANQTLIDAYNSKVMNSIVEGDGVYDDTDLVDIERILKCPPPEARWVQQTRDFIRAHKLAFPLPRQ